MIFDNNPKHSFTLFMMLFVIVFFLTGMNIIDAYALPFNQPFDSSYQEICFSEITLSMIPVDGSTVNNEDLIKGLVNISAKNFTDNTVVNITEGDCLDALTANIIGQVD